MRPREIDRGAKYQWCRRLCPRGRALWKGWSTQCSIETIEHSTTAGFPSAPPDSLCRTLFPVGAPAPPAVTVAHYSYENIHAVGHWLQLTRWPRLSKRRNSDRV